MLQTIITNRFEKDVKLAKKRNKDLKKLLFVMNKLVNERPLSIKYKDHTLIGNYINYRDCHIEPDWLLIYIVEETAIN